MIEEGNRSRSRPGRLASLCRKVLAEKSPFEQLRDDDSKVVGGPKADRSSFTSAVEALTKKARGLEAPVCQTRRCSGRLHRSAFVMKA